MSDELSSEQPAVLIIGDRWGSLFHGPVSGAMRHFAQFFHSLGLRVYCAVLKMTDQEYDDALENHVELIPPVLPLTLKNKTPSDVYLFACETFYPDILKIKNVKIVFDFSLVTSAATQWIRERIMTRAKLYIEHCWSSDVPPIFLGCNKTVLLTCLESLLIETKPSSALVSIDHETFQHYEQKLQEIQYKQYRFSLIPDKKYLDSQQPKLPKETLPPNILSFMEEYDLTDMKNHQVLSSALNKVVTSFYDFTLKPPTWNILGVPEAKESHVLEKLNPHPHLNIVPSSLPSIEYMENEFRTCHLLLIPPSPGMNSLHLMLSAMALGIPFIVPMYSPCHEMIKQHFTDLEMDSLIADMTDVREVADKIRYILCKQNKAWTKAWKVKQHLKDTVLSALHACNADFKTKVEEDVGLDALKRRGIEKDWSEEAVQVPSISNAMLGQPGGDSVSCVPDSNQKNHKTRCHPSCKSQADQPGGCIVHGKRMTRVSSSIDLEVENKGVAIDEGFSADNDSGDESSNRQVKHRKPGQMKLHVNAAGGVPETGNSIKSVEKKYYQLPEVRSQTPDKLSNMRNGISTVEVHGNSIVYVLQCETLDDLEYLWKEYEALHLNQLITDTTITEKTLMEIGASYFSIQTTLDIAEYAQCRKELQKDGHWKIVKQLDYHGEGVRGMTMNHHGQVFLACERTNRVLTLDSSFVTDYELRYDGQFAKKFKPYDVAVTTTDKYYIADWGNNQILVHNKITKSTQTFCENDDIAPGSITLLDNCFVVADRKGLRVIKYNQYGKSVAQVGGNVRPSQLIEPVCVVVNSDRNVIVLDWVHGDKVTSTIQVFNSDLQHLFTMYSGGDKYFGLSVDIWDNVYCVGDLIESTDSGTNAIAKYTKNGELVEKFETDNWALHITVGNHTRPIICTSDPYNEQMVTVYTK